MAAKVKCKCIHSNCCSNPYHASYVLGCFDRATFELVKPLRFFHGPCTKAEEICIILQVKNPQLMVNYDNA